MKDLQISRKQIFLWSSSQHITTTRTQVQCHSDEPIRTGQCNSTCQMNYLFKSQFKAIKIYRFCSEDTDHKLPLLYETSYASKASFSCCNFSHILNRYDPHRSPPCFGGLFVEERLSFKYKPTSFPGSSLFLPLTKHFPRGVSHQCLRS